MSVINRFMGMVRMANLFVVTLFEEALIMITLYIIHYKIHTSHIYQYVPNRFIKRWQK